MSITRFKKHLLLMGVALTMLCWTSCQQASPTPQATATSQLVNNVTKQDFVAPVCKKQAKELSIHGDTRVDNYYWQAKDYPALMVTTGLHDSQVQYWEPAKWVAKLREMKTDNNPLILHTNMEAGHGGKSGRFRRLEETAMEYSFFLELAGKATIKG